jgi:hypothetical protein
VGKQESTIPHDICRLFSKFTVSTTSHQHVRIASAELEYPKTGLHGVKIASCLPSKRGVVAEGPGTFFENLLLVRLSYIPNSERIIGFSHQVPAASRR